MIDKAHGGGSAVERYEPTLATGVAIFALIGSFLNFINYNHYPLFTFETFTAIAVLAAICVCVGLLYDRIGRLCRILLNISLLYIVFELNFDGWIKLAAIPLGLIPAIVFVPLVGIASVVVFLGQLSVAIAGPETAVALEQSVSKSDRPAIVHILLDEHIGIEGAPDTPDGRAFRESLKTFYGNRGFKLFGGAYAEYMHTTNSVPQVLNLGRQQPWSLDDLDGKSVPVNAYFQWLKDKGYSISVQQTDYMDYCSFHAVAECKTYQNTGLEALVNLDLPVMDKSVLLLSEFALLAPLSAKLSFTYDISTILLERRGLDLPRLELGTRLKGSSLTALMSLRDLSNRVRTAQPGEAYFAHILLPHYPYVATPECGVKLLRDWLYRGSDVPIDVRYRAYFEQIACTTAMIGEIRDALLASPAGRNSIMIVHGDHGSRINHVDPNTDTSFYDEEDLIFSHSTLFAVAAPRIAPGYTDAQIPIAGLLAQLVNTDFTAATPDLPPDFKPTIVLQSSDREPMHRIAFPDYAEE